MKTILALLSSALVLVGCAAPRDLYMPSAESFSVPALGQIASATPGEKMLSQGRNRVYESLDIQQPIAVGAFRLPPGRYIKESESAQAEFFAWDEVTNPTRGGISSNGDTLKSIVVLKNGKAICVQTFTSRIYCEDGFSVPRTRTAVVDQASFQATLIYSGRVGNKISLSYREFNDGLARAAFTNTAEYDLSESSIVVYKGAQIEVLEATNQFIRYRVLKNFNEGR
jgi:hypothetical protein